MRPVGGAQLAERGEQGCHPPVVGEGPGRMEPERADAELEGDDGR